jgi:hypothetical protein
MANERDRKPDPVKTKPVRKSAQTKAPSQKLKDAPPSELSEGDGSPGLSISGGGGHA